MTYVLLLVDGQRTEWSNGPIRQNYDKTVRSRVVKIGWKQRSAVRGAHITFLLDYQFPKTPFWPYITMFVKFLCRCCFANYWFEEDSVQPAECCSVSPHVLIWFADLGVLKTANTGTFLWSVLLMFLPFRNLAKCPHRGTLHAIWRDSQGQESQQMLFIVYCVLYPVERSCRTS